MTDPSGISVLAVARALMVKRWQRNNEGRMPSEDDLRAAPAAYWLICREDAVAAIEAMAKAGLP